ncbi:hypothetical protein LEP1GSC187_1150 [Leptospira santarosai str. ZUN179]|uniref:Uncharacterized protein n=1 Tax=Leptospira santarosai str. ZUN179 TaxID=1049985 RepID=M6V1L7_9LEPT|nr:hypothetical protein LEP1GSC187_1150 [Leptospira santarosai str. ZUN179]
MAIEEIPYTEFTLTEREFGVIKSESVPNMRTLTFYYELAEMTGIFPGFGGLMKRSKKVFE